MRTHHGTHPRRSVQFDADAATLAHHRTWAQVHLALFPLLRTLVQQAMTSGLPVCRALLLHHPEDATAWSVEDQFLLGPDLLVAPVVERGARGRSVYLPAGQDWVDLWSGQRQSGGRRVEVTAPIGVVPLFLRASGAIATFDTYADTLVRRAQTREADLRTLDDAHGSLSILVGPDFAGPLTLWDGTRVEIAGAGAGDPLAPAPGVTHALLPAALTACWTRHPSGSGRHGWLPAGQRRLQVQSPIERRFTAWEVAGRRHAASRSG
jgi:hypothetical protein